MQKVTIGVLIAVLLVIIVVANKYPLSELIDTEALTEALAALGITGILLFVAVGVVFTAVGLPRQLLAFIGGYTYGVLPGLLLGTLAALGGCLVSFMFSRWLLSAWVARKFSTLVAMLNRLIEQDTFLKILVLRIQPLGTNLATNLAAGVSNINMRVFLISSLVGYLPQMLVFALMGSGVRVQSSTRLSISAVLLLISLLLAYWLYRRHVSSEQG